MSNIEELKATADRLADEYLRAATSYNHADSPSAQETRDLNDLLHRAKAAREAYDEARKTPWSDVLEKLAALRMEKRLAIARELQTAETALCKAYLLGGGGFTTHDEHCKLEGIYLWVKDHNRKEFKP